MSPRILDEKNLRSTEDAFLWLLDCTLATVEMMAMKKTPPVGEYSRQIGMAQAAMDVLLREGKDVTPTRAGEISEKFNRSVKSWAEHIHAKFHP